MHQWHPPPPRSANDSAIMPFSRINRLLHPSTMKILPSASQQTPHGSSFFPSTSGVNSHTTDLVTGFMALIFRRISGEKPFKTKTLQGTNSFFTFSSDKTVYYIWVEFLNCLLAAHTLINCISGKLYIMVHEYANI